MLLHQFLILLGLIIGAIIFVKDYFSIKFMILSDKDRIGLKILLSDNMSTQCQQFKYIWYSVISIVDVRLIINYILINTKDVIK
jgi:hypothetical protein